jgi:hypothetical protein
MISNRTKDEDEDDLWEVVKSRGTTRTNGALNTYSRDGLPTVKMRPALALNRLSAGINQVFLSRIVHTPLAKTGWWIGGYRYTNNANALIGAFRQRRRHLSSK